MTSVHWASGLEVFAAISPAFALLLMDEKYLSGEAPEPNLPVVPVRGITAADMMRLCERYNLDFSPPTYNEQKLGEIIVALEEMVMDFTRREQSRRS